MIHHLNEHGRMGMVLANGPLSSQTNNKSDIRKAFDAFREGTLEEEKGFSAVVTTEDIAKQDYILTPGRYIGIPDDGEPFEEKTARPTGELSKCFEESNRLQGRD